MKKQCPKFKVYILMGWYGISEKARIEKVFIYRKHAEVAKKRLEKEFKDASFGIVEKSLLGVDNPGIRVYETLDQAITSRLNRKSTVLVLPRKAKA